MASHNVSRLDFSLFNSRCIEVLASSLILAQLRLREILPPKYTKIELEDLAFSAILSGGTMHAGVDFRLKHLTCSTSLRYRLALVT